MSAQIISSLKQLKLHGMAASFPEVCAQARHTEFKAIYRVSLQVDSASLASASDQGLRGQVVIQSAWSAPAWRYLRQAASVLVRELGF